jgi:hypothetical protein
VSARLVNLRASSAAGGHPTLDETIDGIIRELDTSRSRVKNLRGEARAAFLDRLRELERALLDAARNVLDPGTLAGIAAEADTELAPFRDRMPAAAYQRSHAACVNRIVRERFRLPTVTFE